jgi:hypothetical protein
VKDYVRIARTRSREAFVPLAHPPGHAQVDFGECIGVIGGVRMKLRVFCFDLPQSDACFIKAYPAETTEAFLDGHVSAFAFFMACRSRFYMTISKSQWRAFLATASGSAPGPSPSSSAITYFKSVLADRAKATTRYHEDPRQSRLAPAVQNARHERGSYHGKYRLHLQISGVHSYRSHDCFRVARIEPRTMARYIAFSEHEQNLAALSFLGGILPSCFGY